MCSFPIINYHSVCSFSVMINERTLKRYALQRNVSFSGLTILPLVIQRRQLKPHACETLVAYYFYVSL